MNGMFDPKVLQYIQKKKEEQQSPFGGMGEVPPLQEPMQPSIPSVDPLARMGEQQLPEVQPPQMSQQPPPQLPPDISPAIPGKSLLEGVLGTPQPQEMVPPVVPSQIPPQAPPQRPVPYQQGMLNQQSPQPPADKLREYLEQLRGSDAQLEAAQQQAAEGRRNAGIMGGVEQLARAIGRQPQNPNAYRAEAEAADQPVKDLLQQRKLGSENLEQYIKLKKLESEGQLSLKDQIYLNLMKQRIDQSGRSIDESVKSRKANLEEREEGRKLSEKRFKTSMVKDYQKEGRKYVDKQKDALIATNLLEGLIKRSATEGEQNIAAVGTQLALAMGEKGRLTDEDVIRYLKGKSWGRQFKLWAEGAMQGTLPKQDAKTLNSMLGYLRDIHQNVYNAKYDEIATSYQRNLEAAGIPITKEEALYRINPSYVSKSSETQTGKTQSVDSTTQSGPSPQDVQKYAQQYKLDPAKAEAILRKRMGQ